METTIYKRKKLSKAIEELPDTVLPELTEFIHYLQFKTAVPHLEKTVLQPTSGSAFLLAIAGIGESEETDLSERDEEILANEIDPVRGWGLAQDNL
jgi:hypothetical protein